MKVSKYLLHKRVAFSDAGLSIGYGMCNWALQDAYPNATDIRGLARRCGPGLANSVGLLIDENKSLRLKLEASLRSHARLQGKAANLGEALREHEERAYVRDLEGSVLDDKGVISRAVGGRSTTGPLGANEHHGSSEQSENLAGGNFVKRYCACSEKLQELLDCIDSQLGNYERGVWQTQVNVLEEERDSLMMK